MPDRPETPGPSNRGELPPSGRDRSLASSRPADTASRRQPVLVLHDMHTFRCWPGAMPQTDDAPAHAEVIWIVEVDGMTEHAGPSLALDSTVGEIDARVRRWWNDRRGDPGASRE